MRTVSVPQAEVGRPVLQGRQPLAGLWFPADWFSPMERRRRILANWRAGAGAFAFPQGDLLRFPAAEEGECASLSGWPLRLEGHTLCSAALAPSERGDLPAADLWIVIGGRVVAMNLSDATPLDPAAWLQVDDYSLFETYDCRMALPEPTLEIPEQARDLREVLGDAIPPASEEQATFLRALHSRRERPAPQRENAVSKRLLPRWVVGWLWVVFGIVLVAQAKGSLVPFLSTLVLTLAVAALLRGLAGGGGSEQPARARHPSRRPTRSEQPIPERREPGTPQRWRAWLARMAMMSRVSRLLGRRQAAYLRRMIDLFETGQVEEALRHAISLGDEGGSLGQSFGTPSARKELSLSRSIGPGAGIHLGQQMEDYLRRLYRNTFEKLDRAGRVNEAMFVLAELLQSRQEALDYMEKHGRFSEAAELALAWDRPSDVIVRLHCLAGDWRRAVAVARRDGAFANAVLMLEKRWPEPAKRLRLEWADALATQGDWLGAVEAVWPLAEHRDKARAWLASAEAGGGQLAARALVKRAILLPDTLDAYADYLAALRDERERYPERAAVAEALLALKGDRGPATRLARILAPALLADQFDGVGGLSRKEVQNLVALTNDRLLRADLPNQTLPVATPTPLRKHASFRQLEAPPAGSRPILDALPLEEGRYLLAFGEAGAAVVDSAGRMLFRMAVPAEKLVLAYNRQLALALASRGEVWRVSRLDLSNRRASDLGVLDFEHFAGEFDGIAWSVAGGSRIRVLDTARSLQTVLWQVHDLPGSVRAMSANPRLEQLLIVGDDGTPALWRYSLPQRRLMSRDSVEMPDRDQLSLLNPDGGLFTATLRNGDDGRPVLAYQRFQIVREVALPAADAYTLEWLETGNDWLILGLEGQTVPSMLWFVNLADGQCRARIEWPSLSGLGLRPLGSCWLVFDDQGRLLLLDTESGRMERLAV